VKEHRIYVREIELILLIAAAGFFLFAGCSSSSGNSEKPYTISLSYPQNNQTDLPVVLTFEWTVSETAPQNVVYDLYLSADSEFRNRNIYTTSMLYQQVGGLIPGQKYYWKVLVRNSQSQAAIASSETFTFSVAASPGWQQLGQTLDDNVTVKEAGIFKSWVYVGDAEGGTGLWRYDSDLNKWNSIAFSGMKIDSIINIEDVRQYIGLLRDDDEEGQGGLYYSEDGENYTKTELGDNDSVPYVIKFNSGYYAGTSSGLYVSLDGITGWTQVQREGSVEGGLSIDWLYVYNGELYACGMAIDEDLQITAAIFKLNSGTGKLELVQDYPALFILNMISLGGKIYFSMFPGDNVTIEQTVNFTDYSEITPILKSDGNELIESVVDCSGVLTASLAKIDAETETIIDGGLFGYVSGVWVRQFNRPLSGATVTSDKIYVTTFNQKGEGVVNCEVWVKEK
jgi:hypothetical protein